MAVEKDFMAKVQVVARAVAKETVRELQNQGGLVNLDEARQILIAESGDVTEFECAGCHRSIADPTIRSCPDCGSRVARVKSNARYRCERCGTPISDPHAQATCPRCGHDRAIEAGAKPNPPVTYTCSSCLSEVSLQQPACRCGSTKAYRTVEV